MQRGVPNPTPAQILTPHTCLEGSAPDLEEEDTTVQDAAYIPQIPGEEDQRLPLDAQLSSPFLKFLASSGIWGKKNVRSGL